jgi:hypothetical protein
MTTPYQPVNPSMPFEEEYAAQIEATHSEIAYCSKIRQNSPSDAFKHRIYALEHDLQVRLCNLREGLLNLKIGRWVADCRMDSFDLEEIEKAARAVLQDHPHPWRAGNTIRDANDDLVADSTSSSTDRFLMMANPTAILVLIAEIKRLQQIEMNNDTA